MVLPEDRDPGAGQEPAKDSASAPTEGLSAGFLAPGQVLGDRYQIRSQLGRGGMGEVWRALDLKLRVEVALKALREDLFQDDRRRELLRSEVRAAREVVSPNVCRVYDLIEADGRELVSMEYVDGQTLLAVLQERGPLELKEAQDIASQFLAGLEAIHKAGLVHRDVKPENIMLTRAGRVVVMDFGLARGEAEGGGTVSGTPAYMAPEQAAGLAVDARADVYSAGVVLAEMVSPDGIKSLQSRQSVWEGVRREPARVPETPWAPVLKKAVAKDPEARYRSAHTLTRALEDVTLRVEGAEDLHPYPGLSSFTEADAEYFFGREAEVEQMWMKLDRAHLLGIVGPSGAGKTSFLRAGLMPSAPAGWGIVVCSPGNAALRSLRQELASQLAGDALAMRELVDAEDADATVSAVSRWRRRHEHTLLIVDQFEELFTQNAPGVKAQFADLLGRLVLEADVFVLLSMRDDFLFHCHQYEALSPMVSALTLLGPPTGANLRRALVQPAMKCGYRFEDDGLVEEMLSEVEGERGALPLLAFAAARLWEKRDREAGLLTRQAYQDIGGVGGALARHAEATMERIGSERVAIVRELFRNLVTAEGTRAVREWDELLSVFADSRRESAREVLRALIDARLLTSYELRKDEGEPTSRVEIIHESLLANWPRLQRWLAQDAEGALLRDQLRQAARTWHEHARSDDLLWTGSAFREFAVWRERYPGGLTELEEAFAVAMTALATRRRRRRRIAVAAGFAVLLAVLAVVGTSLRRTRAALERTDASRLVALGRAVGVEADPTAALAYAIASLERADSLEARMLALDAMAHGPIAFIVEDYTFPLAFSRDGRWLCGGLGGELRVWSRDGSRSVFPVAGGGYPYDLLFPPDGSAVITVHKLLVRAWELPAGALLGELENRVFPRPPVVLASPGDEPRLAVLELEPGSAVLHTLPLRRSAVPVALRFDLSAWFRDPPTYEVERDGERRTLPAEPALDPMGQWLAVPVGREVVLQPLVRGSPARVLARHEARVWWLEASPDGRAIAAGDETGAIRLWSVATGEETARLDGGTDRVYRPFSADGASFLSCGRPTSAGTPTLSVWRLGQGSAGPGRTIVLPEGSGYGDMGWVFSGSARWIAAGHFSRAASVWNLGWPAEAGPVTLRRKPSLGIDHVSVHPDGAWVAASGLSGTAVWPLEERAARTLVGHGGGIGGLAFAPDGSWLASNSGDGILLWPLAGNPPPPVRVLLDRDQNPSLTGLEASADGRLLALGSVSWGGALVSTEGVVRRLPGFARLVHGVTLSDDGRLAAAGGFSAEEAFVRVWDLESGREVARLDAGDRKHVKGALFLAGGGLVSWGTFGIRLWDVAAGSFRPLWVAPAGQLVPIVKRSSADLLAFSTSPLDDDGGPGYTLDPATGAVRRLASHGDLVNGIALDESGTVVATASVDGVVRVGPASGEEPHLLLGHTVPVYPMEISRRGDWLASGDRDGTIRLWPMPDLSQPPAHTLPLPELLAKLESQTNLRVVADPAAPGGYRTEPGPFPGWAEVPTWQP